MTFEEFVREEEQREKQRREAKLSAEQKRLAEDTQRVKRELAKKSYDERKAAQRAQLERIMTEATDRYRESKKKTYENLGQPPMVPVDWLVFDRVTGELYGEATKSRAYQAWSEVNPTKLVPDKNKPGESVSEAVGFNACRCVLRSEWEAVEAKFRNKKTNGVTHGNQK